MKLDPRHPLPLKGIGNPNDKSEKLFLFFTFFDRPCGYFDHLSFELHLAFGLCHLTVRGHDQKFLKRDAPILSGLVLTFL
jgi:hypothetical protein